MSHLDRVIETEHARTAATGAAEQAIRDARAAGHTVLEIATALGTKNRPRLYNVLDKPDLEPTADTPLPPMVHLRTRKRENHVHTHLAQAMMARGWYVEPDHMRAWHLARAGARVVMVDASAHLHGEGVLQIGHIRAIHGPLGDHEFKWISLDEYPTDDGTRVARWVAEHIPTV